MPLQQSERRPRSYHLEREDDRFNQASYPSNAWEREPSYPTNSQSYPVPEFVKGEQINIRGQKERSKSDRRYTESPEIILREEQEEIRKREERSTKELRRELGEQSSIDDKRVWGRGPSGRKRDSRPYLRYTKRSDQQRRSEVVRDAEPPSESHLPQTRAESAAMKDGIELQRIISDYREKEEAREKSSKITAEKLAEIALSTRSRSKSRSEAQSPRRISRSLVVRSAFGDGTMPPRRSSTSSTDAFISRSPSRRSTYEYPTIDTIVEHEQWRGDGRIEVSMPEPFRRVVELEDSPPRRRVERTPSYGNPGRSILKASVRTDLNPDEAGEDSPSDVYPSEEESEVYPSSDSSSGSSDQERGGDAQELQPTSSTRRSPAGLDRRVSGGSSFWRNHC